MIENITIFAPLVSGVWLVGTGLMMHTKNVLSSMVFKIVPFFLGLACLYSGLHQLGVL